MRYSNAAFSIEYKVLGREAINTELSIQYLVLTIQSQDRRATVIPERI